MKQIKVIIVGAGNRSMIYANYAKTNPDEMKIVGVAEPDEVRRKMAQDLYNIPDNMCFTSAEELAKKGKLADAVINGTMDKDHVPTSISLLKAGYDILLEKPFALNEKEMNKLLKVAHKTGRKVVICHVLRYTPFYTAIKERLISGEIGDIINIQLTEHVCYHHMDAAFVRGKWGSDKKCGAPMLLAKCCHDTDLMMWLMGDVLPETVASFGSDFAYGKKNKPENAGTRCLVDCPLEKECIHSAGRNYLTSIYRWGAYVWTCLEGKSQTHEDKVKSLKTDNEYGRCVWDMERDTNVDHQSVLVNFENGATGTLNMIGGTSRPERQVHIIGTKGEIKGVFDEGKFVIRKHMPEESLGAVFETVEFNMGKGDQNGVNGNHGGGDALLPKDFVSYIRGEEPSISCTSIDKSALSHLLVFRAEKSRKTNKTVKMNIK